MRETVHHRTHLHNSHECMQYSTTPHKIPPTNATTKLTPHHTTPSTHSDELAPDVGSMPNMPNAMFSGHGLEESENGSVFVRVLTECESAT